MSPMWCGHMGGMLQFIFTLRRVGAVWQWCIVSVDRMPSDAAIADGSWVECGAPHLLDVSQWRFLMNIPIWFSVMVSKLAIIVLHCCSWEWTVTDKSSRCDRNTRNELVPSGWWLLLRHYFFIEKSGAKFQSTLKRFYGQPHITTPFIVASELRRQYRVPSTSTRRNFIIVNLVVLEFPSKIHVLLYDVSDCLSERVTFRVSGSACTGCTVTSSLDLVTRSCT